jgi:sugar transferase (PEP-CTERM/EpsH1 system associated)
MNVRIAPIGRADSRPLIVHVVFRFDVGGLENGVVNLINRIPSDAYRHAIVSLTEITDFRNRIVKDDVQFFALNKKPGHGFVLYPKLIRLFRSLRPSILHTRNLAALEATVPAWFAGVQARVHGEHGRDVGDLEGSNRRYQRIRRIYRPFVSRYVALSQDLDQYLRNDIGVDAARISRICNGVDTTRFAPAIARAPIEGSPFNDAGLWIVGTVGRIQAVKDQLTLAHAFVATVQNPAVASRMRLVMVGDGPLRAEVERVLSDAGVRHLAWLAGERSDIPEILRGLDCFVLPSLAEGISNTILEAMASGLPVVATRVGGNAELVEEGVTGRLVAPADSESLARANLGYFHDRESARDHGRAARQTTVQRFSLERMVGDYLSLYDSLLVKRRAQPAQVRASGM